MLLGKEFCKDAFSERLWFSVKLLQGALFFSQLDFFLMSQFRKNEGHFNSKHGGNYVVDIVHIC